MSNLHYSIKKLRESPRMAIRGKAMERMGAKLGKDMEGYRKKSSDGASYGEPLELSLTLQEERERCQSQHDMKQKDD